MQAENALFGNYFLRSPNLASCMSQTACLTVWRKLLGMINQQSIHRTYSIVARITPSELSFDQVGNTLGWFSVSMRPVQGA